MTALSTEARNALATLLEGTGRRTHKVAPASPVPPCYVIRPDSPWMEPRGIGSGLSMTVRLAVLVVGDARNGEAGLIDLEDATEAAIAAVDGAFQVVSAGPPQLLDVNASSQVMVTELALRAEMKE